jgi:hypothetical protein
LAKYGFTASHTASSDSNAAIISSKFNIAISFGLQNNPQKAGESKSFNLKIATYSGYVIS